MHDLAMFATQIRPERRHAYLVGLDLESTHRGDQLVEVVDKP
jgi:hypothetical protein